MNKFLITLFITFFAFSNLNAQTKCDVKEIYSGIDAKDDVKVLTRRNDLVEAEIILIPTQLDLGQYSISVTRKDSDLYKVDSKDIYIETRYCYEYATYEDAILIIEGNYSYNKGKIIFTE